MDKKNYIIREHRSNYTKERIQKKFPEFDMDGKTEWDAMQELGYDRIWDCGVLAYVWQNKNPLVS